MFPQGRNIILASLCPQVYGLYVVKLAVGMVLAGGVARRDATGIRTRGESHLLLVGDPGQYVIDYIRLDYMRLMALDF